MYVTLEEADAYFAGLLFVEPWREAEAEAQTAALTQANRAVNQALPSGDPEEEGQDDKWPLLGMPLPAEVGFAVCEEALALLRLQADPDAYNRSLLRRQGVKSLTYGHSSESYADHYGDKGPFASLCSEEAKAFLRGVINGSVWQR
jgi:hypothetical protein